MLDTTAESDETKESIDGVGACVEKNISDQSTIRSTQFLIKGTRRYAKLFCLESNFQLPPTDTSIFVLSQSV